MDITNPVVYTKLFGDMMKLAANEETYSVMGVYQVAEDHFDGMFKGAPVTEFTDIYSRIRANNMLWRDQRAADDMERDACQSIIDICEQEMKSVSQFLERSSTS